MTNSATLPTRTTRRNIGLDAVLLILLVLARVRIDTFSDAIVHKPPELLFKIPFLAAIFTPETAKLMQDWITDPVTILIIVIGFGLTLGYLVLDMTTSSRTQDGDEPAKWVYATKLGLLFGIIAILVVGNTLWVVSMRHFTDPAQFAHDGGVLMPESAMDFIAQGKNPYIESYRGTPMEKAFPNGPGLTHYPYLPWTFLASIPLRALANDMWGWWDERFMYLLGFAFIVGVAPLLCRSRREGLILTAMLGLNPVMANDLVYGMNDYFILFWIVLSIFLLRARLTVASLFALGLACASKPTAWFLLPFYFLYLYGLHHDQKLSLPAFARWIGWSAARAWPVLLVLALIVGPFAVWSWHDLYDDVWLYNLGNTTDTVPVKGWGFSNLILLWGLLKDKYAYFSFFPIQALFGLPLFAWMLWRQWRQNTLNVALTNYALFLLVFLFFSRYINYNYIGYILAFFGLGYWVDLEPVPITAPALNEARAETPASGEVEWVDPATEPAPTN